MTRGSIDQRSDQDLLSAHVDGDPYAFATLIHRHQSALTALAMRTLHNPEDAADALQDALLRASCMADGFRSDAAVGSWLHRIVANSCLDRLRRNKVRMTLPLPDYDLMVFADPRDHTATVDLSLSIGRALDALPAPQREAIIAVDIEGLSVAEAADRFGVATGTIKSRCARGRLKLAKDLGHLRQID